MPTRMSHVDELLHLTWVASSVDIYKQLIRHEGRGILYMNFTLIIMLFSVLSALFVSFPYSLRDDRK